MAATNQRPPLLDLTTQQVRPVVRIDSVPYEVRLLDDLPLSDALRVHEPLNRIRILVDAETPPTKAEAVELQALLKRTCRLALVADDEITDRLSDVQRLEVYTLFAMLLTPRLQMARAPMEAPVPARPSASNGRKRSRGSRAFTAATPPPGSQPSPSA